MSAERSAARKRRWTDAVPWLAPTMIGGLAVGELIGFVIRHV